MLGFLYAMSLISEISMVVLRPALAVFNGMHYIIRGGTKVRSSGLPELREIEERAASKRTDIADHLATIFSEAAALNPRLIVELGVRGGESRFVFERVAARCGAHLVSVDVDDCRQVCTQRERWHFVQADDIEFAANFAEWARQHGIAPAVDVLFIDTTHLYEHTVEELRAWTPLLSPHCKLILHDTNLRTIMRRADGTLWLAWNNQRGVIRAVEELLGITLDERKPLVTAAPPWSIRHWAYSNGLTVLER
jgi:predicted O-methyltransferase YrrM